MGQFVCLQIVTELGDAREAAFLGMLAPLAQGLHQVALGPAIRHGDAPQWVSFILHPPPGQRPGTVAERRAKFLFTNLGHHFDMTRLIPHLVSKLHAHLPGQVRELGQHLAHAVGGLHLAIEQLMELVPESFD